MRPMSERPPLGLIYVRVNGDRWFLCRVSCGQVYPENPDLNNQLPGKPEGWIGVGFKYLKGQAQAFGEPHGKYGPSNEPCPWCGRLCECDVADVGVGYQQVGPYHCVECGASQIGPYDKPRDLTAAETVTGWYAPGAEPGSSANVIGGKIVSADQMKDAYQAQFTGNPDWHDTEKVKQWYEEIRKP